MGEGSVADPKPAESEVAVPTSFEVSETKSLEDNVTQSKQLEIPSSPIEINVPKPDEKIEVIVPIPVEVSSASIIEIMPTKPVEEAGLTTPREEKKIKTAKKLRKTKRTGTKSSKANA